MFKDPDLRPVLASALLTLIIYVGSLLNPNAATAKISEASSTMKLSVFAVIAVMWLLCYFLVAKLQERWKR